MSSAIAILNEVGPFVSVSWGAYQTWKEIYSLANGNNHDAFHARIITSRFQAASQELESSGENLDPAIKELCNSCAKLCQELLGQLDKAAPKGKSTFRRYICAIEAWLKAEDIRKTLRQLDQYRSQLSFEIQNELWKAQRKESRKKDLEAALRRLAAYSTTREKKFDTATRGTFEWMLHDVRAAVAQQADAAEDGDAIELAAKAIDPPDPLNPDGHQSPPIELQSMNPHRPDVSEYDTRRGLRTKEDVAYCFHRFLSSQETGTFLIRGKAASGKSTLTEFLATDPDVIELVKVWAQQQRSPEFAEAPLLIARHAFWAAGRDDLQHSREGFVRSILSQLIRINPDLMHDLVESNGLAISEQPLSDAVLENLLQRLASFLKSGQILLFAIIDALDEHDADNRRHSDFANMLISWSSSPFVKILCSSRDEASIVKPFQASGDVMTLQAHTRDDIVVFARTCFELGLSEAAHHRGRDICVSLIPEISRYAQGVFLWVRIVVNQLIEDVIGGDSQQESLQSTLLKFPRGELDDVYTYMLEKVRSHPKNSEKLDILLHIFLNWPFSVPIKPIHLAVLDDLNWAMNVETLQGWYHDGYETQVAKMIDTSDSGARLFPTLLDQVRIIMYTLTRGLLDIDDTKHVVVEYMPSLKVIPCHRTVFDFLGTKATLRNPFVNPEDELIALQCLRMAELKAVTFVSCLNKVSRERSGNTRALHVDWMLQPTLTWLQDLAARDRRPSKWFLDEMRTTFRYPHLEQVAAMINNSYVTQLGSERYRHPEAYDGDWLCICLRARQGWYVRDLIITDSLDLATLQQSSGMSLLLEAAITGDAETVACLMGAGERGIEDKISLAFDFEVPGIAFPKVRSVWEVFLVALLGSAIETKSRWKPGQSAAREAFALACYGLELLLEAGADGRVTYHISYLDPSSEVVHSHWIELKSLISDTVVAMISPPNELRLLELINRPRTSSEPRYIGGQDLRSSEEQLTTNLREPLVLVLVGLTLG